MNQIVFPPFPSVIVTDMDIDQNSPLIESYERSFQEKIKKLKIKKINL